MSNNKQNKGLHRIKNIKHKIVVLSGKGGVGKSTVSAQLALTLMHQGFKVGILDIDICGPSIPKILGVEGSEVLQCSEGWVPVYLDNNTNKLSIMSIGFLLSSPDDAVVWRGPKKHSMIQQFLEDVYWGDLDILIVDTPPGTSDEHITLVELLRDTNPDGAILVTTPQGVSLSDVRREINFCKKLKLPILGLIENMSGFACPCCKEITYIFSKGGGQLLSKEYNVPLLGMIPIDPQLGQSEDKGRTDFVKKFPNSTSAIKLKEITDSILKIIKLEPPKETQEDKMDIENVKQ